MTGRRGEWRSWSGLVGCTPRRTVRPESVTDVVDRAVVVRQGTRAVEAHCTGERDEDAVEGGATARVVVRVTPL